MVTIIKDEELTKISGNVKPDSKRRVVLPGSLVRKDITYHIYCNSFGQIVLDPQVSIPASEAWLYRNPAALKLFRQGLDDYAKGKISKVKRSEL